jgi:hypothetical protein
MPHDSQSPLAWSTVTIKSDVPLIGGKQFVVEDWHDRIEGGFGVKERSPVWIQYAMRRDSRLQNLAAVREALANVDDDVLYGKIGWQGYLVHVSELAA